MSSYFHSSTVFGPCPEEEKIILVTMTALCYQPIWANSLEGVAEEEVTDARLPLPKQILASPGYELVSVTSRLSLVHYAWGPGYLRN